MIMDTMLQNIPQRLHEVNTLLATCRQGVFSFGEALPLSLFYRDFSDTNLLVKEAVCLVKENPGRLLDFSSSLLLENRNLPVPWTATMYGRPLKTAIGSVPRRRKSLWYGFLEEATATTRKEA